MNNIYSLYLDLLKKHGSPGKYWPQWCSKSKSERDREIIALGAILTQRTSWHNAELALLNLQKANLLSFEKIGQLKSPEILIPLVRVAGFYQSKPKRIFAFSEFVLKNKILKREELLKIKGIGPETADTILLYAFDKPTFVIDEYTRKLIKRHNLSQNLSYDFLKNLFEENLPPQTRVYQDFHALIIFNQKDQRGWGMKKI
ncbi:MAG: hypothetical protein M1514_02930 [Patescibacteria group bacterium]|nr:hypothetical protein [Patescibacteria group bacterium]